MLKTTTSNNYKLDNSVVENFSKTKSRVLLFPLLILVLIFFVLLKESAFTVDSYINIQKDLFFYLNSKLAQSPILQFNLTQLGDASIILSLITIFLVYAPQLWESILTSSLIALIVSFLLKKLFAVPRPAAMFDNDSFVIIGKTLSGATSLPSGHSITTFTTITILLFAFMPKDFKSKLLWSISILTIGLIIAFSRVGVGAHYPLDVLIGSTIGYISAFLGIFINKKNRWWSWIQNKKYYPFFMFVLTIWILAIIKKTFDNNLVIFYFSICSLITTLFLMIRTYVKK
jgi:membrane-associated phospholipid phosphatase